MGGSNGGLLVGAVEVQRPELFGACIPMVGVMDMLRFHQFTAGQFWRDEYGYVEKADEFKALLGLLAATTTSRTASHYPPTLIMTADTDDRVVPMHSFKFAAALQRAQAGDEPILLRIESRAGHGARHAGRQDDRNGCRPLGVSCESARHGRAGGMRTSRSAIQADFNLAALRRDGINHRISPH